MPVRSAFRRFLSDLFAPAPRPRVRPLGGHLERLDDRLVPARVAVLGAASPDTWIADVEAKVVAAGVFAADDVDTYNVYTSTVTPAALAQYDSVLVFSDYGFLDPVGLGDMLADYVDAGHGVVLAAFGTASVPLAGRWASGGYNPIAPTGQASSPALALGAVAQPDHPVMLDVTTFGGGTSSYRSAGGLTPGTELVASWSNGEPLVADRPGLGARVVGLNFYPPSSNVRTDFWDAATQGGLLLANALNWATGAPAPETTIDAAPGAATGDPTPTFQFSATGGSGGWSYQVSVDGGAFAPAASGFTTAALGDGSHTFRVRAIDSARHVDPTPAVYTFVVDTAAPDTEFLSRLAGAATNNPTPKFEFSSPDADVDHYEVSFDGVTFDPLADGVTTFTAPALADGTYTLRVRAVDGAGSADPTPAEYAFRVDTVAPTVTLTSAAPALVRTRTFRVTATFDEPVFGLTRDDIATPRVTVVNGTASNFVRVSGSVYAFDVTAAREGVVTVNVAPYFAKDAAQNPNTAATPLARTFAAPPAVTIGPPSAARVRAGAAVSFLVTYADPALATATLSARDVVLHRTGTANGAVTVTRLSATAFRVTVVGVTGSGTLGISVRPGTAVDGYGLLAPGTGPGAAFQVVPPFRGLRVSPLGR